MEIPTCKHCGIRPCKKRGNNIVGYRAICTKCNREKYGGLEARKRDRKKYRLPYRKYLKSKCELCSFIPINKCQLDIDHIDGNHENNSPDNLQTLCANCHRLKTFLNKDWE